METAIIPPVPGMGMRIRLLRTAHRMNVIVFAERVSITRQHMSNVELGRSAPSLDLLVRIASELGVSVDYLLGRDEPPSAKAA
jgi:transcriptional regulator with XRE-family HTH domain